MLGKALLMWDYTKLPSIKSCCIDSKKLTIESYLLQMTSCIGHKLKNNNINDITSIYSEFIQNDPLSPNVKVKDIMAIAMHPKLYESEEKLINNSCISLSLKQLAIPIRKDATSSVYQILAVLTNDERLAKMTNMFYSGEIVDLYTIIYKDLYKYFMDLAVDNKYKSLKYASLKNVPELDETAVNENINDNNKLVFSSNDKFIIALKLFEQLVSRELIKSIIMPIPYGVTATIIAELIKDYCVEKFIKDKLNVLPDKNTYGRLAHIDVYLGLRFLCTFKGMCTLACLQRYVDKSSTHPSYWSTRYEGWCVLSRTIV
nr:hypothetical protein [Oedogonium sp. 269]